MNVEALHVLHDLAELFVGHTGGGAHDDGLVHGVGNNLAHAGLAQVAVTLGGGRGVGCRNGLAHTGSYLAVLAAARLPVRTVSTRAASRRRERSMWGFSSCPACCWMRRLKASWRSSR